MVRTASIPETCTISAGTSSSRDSATTRLVASTSARGWRAVSVGVFQASYRELLLAVMPFIAVSMVALALITYIPSISLLIPQLVYGRAW